MPFEFLEDEAIADIAFEAWGRTVEEMFAAAGEATMNVMVGDFQTIEKRTRRDVRVESETLDLLFLNLFQELIYYKDAERILLRVETIRVDLGRQIFVARAELAGEELEMARHELVVDVKAVTLHCLRVEETERGWRAHVILDI